MQLIAGRKALAAVLTFLLIISLAVPALAGKGDKPKYEYQYSIAEDGVTIEKYVATDQAQVTVPATIDDRPVVRIAAFAFATTEVDKDSGYVYTVPRTDIESVSLPDGLIHIGRRAFEGLENLKSIHIPDSVSEMASGVFSDCTQLQQVRLSSSLREIPNNAFRSCALQSIVIPDGVTRVGASAFAQNRDLTEVQLPQTLKEIGDGAFGECRALEHITIPDSLERIGTGALGGSGLRECTLPSAVTEISSGLFMWCDNLTTVRFSTAPERIGQNAFLDCPSLQTVEVDATSGEWQRVNVETEGNDGLAAARTICLQDEPGLQQTSGPSAGPGMQEMSSFFDSVLPQRDSTVRLVYTDAGWQLRGQTAGTKQTALTEADLLDAFVLPDGVVVTLVPNDQSIRETSSSYVATGDRLQFASGGELLGEATVIVDGDVLGTGVMSLSQIVRMGQALSGAEPLEGAFLYAADFTQSGTVALSDLVQEAALFRAVLQN